MSPDHDVYIDLNDLAARLRISRRTAERMLASGEMPRPVRLGRARRWSARLVDEWMRGLAERASGIQRGGDTEKECRGRGRPRSE